MERNPTIYYSNSKSYENFIKWSNEKSRIAFEINHYLGKRYSNLLDIGAGDGTITEMVASIFDSIIIVEPGTTNFKKLQERLISDKFQLINKKFEDYSTDNKFNVVLACHSFKFLKNPLVQLDKIKKMLRENGMFIHLDHQRQNDFLKFYEAYREKILGSDSKSPLSYNYKDILAKVFNSIEEISFSSELVIPNVEDAISIFDFIYDIHHKDIPKKIIHEIRNDLYEKYKNDEIRMNLQQTMHICTL